MSDSPFKELSKKAHPLLRIVHDSSSAEHGKLDEVKRMLRESENLEGDLRHKGHKQRTALHWAARFVDIKFVEALLEACKDADFKKELVNDCDGQGNNTVMLACKMNKPGFYGKSVECIKILEKHGIDLNAQNKQGHNALVVAIRSGNMEAAKYLVGTPKAPKVRVNTETRDGDTALTETCDTHAMPDIAQLLLRRGATVDHVNSTTGWTPLCWAMCRDYDSCARVLIEEGHANLSHQVGNGYTPLMIAIENNSMKCIDYVVNSHFAACGWKLKNSNKHDGLDVAIDHCRHDAIKLFIEKKAFQPQSGLKFAVDRTINSAAVHHSNYMSIVKLLLKLGAVPKETHFKAAAKDERLIALLQRWKNGPPAGAASDEDDDADMQSSSARRGKHRKSAGSSSVSPSSASELKAPAQRPSNTALPLPPGFRVLERPPHQSPQPPQPPQAAPSSSSSASSSASNQAVAKAADSSSEVEAMTDADDSDPHPSQGSQSQGSQGEDAKTAPQTELPEVLELTVKMLPSDSSGGGKSNSDSGSGGSDDHDGDVDMLQSPAAEDASAVAAQSAASTSSATPDDAVSAAARTQPPPIALPAAAAQEQTPATPRTASGLFSPSFTNRRTKQKQILPNGDAFRLDSSASSASSSSNASCSSSVLPSKQPPLPPPAIAHVPNGVPAAPSSAKPPTQPAPSSQPAQPKRQLAVKQKDRAKTAVPSSSASSSSSSRAMFEDGEVVEHNFVPNGLPAPAVSSSSPALSASRSQGNGAGAGHGSRGKSESSSGSSGSSSSSRSSSDEQAMEDEDESNTSESSGDAAKRQHADAKLHSGAKRKRSKSREKESHSSGDSKESSSRPKKKPRNDSRARRSASVGSPTELPRLDDAPARLQKAFGSMAKFLRSVKGGEQYIPRFEEHSVSFSVLFALLSPDERAEFGKLVPSIGHRIEIKTAALRFAKPPPLVPK